MVTEAGAMHISSSRLTSGSSRRMRAPLHKSRCTCSCSCSSSSSSSSSSPSSSSRHVSHRHVPQSNRSSVAAIHVRHPRTTCTLARVSATTSSDSSSSVGAEELREGLNFRTAEAVQDLSSQEDSVREEALLTLADIGTPHTLAVLDRVCERLEDTRGEVRIAALKVVEGARREVPDDLAEALAERLQLVDDEVKLVLLAALFCMGEKAAGSESYVADELALRLDGEKTSSSKAEEKPDEIAVAALQVLGKVAPLCGLDEIKKVFQCLTHPQHVIRESALVILAQLPVSDTVAELCLSSLIQILMVDDSADCRFLAATAMASVVPPPTMRQYQTDLIFMLGDDSPEVRSAVALALSSVDIPSTESVMRLIDLVKDDTMKDVRRGAFLAILEIAAKKPSSDGDGKQAIDLAGDAMERYHGDIMSEMGTMEQEIAEAGSHESSQAFLDFLSEMDGDGLNIASEETISQSGSAQAQVLEQLLGDSGDAELFVPETWTQDPTLPSIGMPEATPDGIDDLDDASDGADSDV